MRLTEDERCFVLIRRLHVELANLHRRMEVDEDTYVRGLEDELIIRLYTDMSGGMLIAPMRPQGTLHALASWTSPQEAVTVLRGLVHRYEEYLASGRTRVRMAKIPGGARA